MNQNKLNRSNLFNSKIAIKYNVELEVIFQFSEALLKFSVGKFRFFVGFSSSF